MIFARTGTDTAPRALHQPQLLLLANSDITHADELAIVAAAAEFCVAVVPWFAVGIRMDSVVALAGYIYEDDGVRRPLRAGERLTPGAVVPLALLEAPGLHIATLIGRLYPQAVLGIADLPAPMQVSPSGSPRGVIALAPTHVRCIGDVPEIEVHRLKMIAAMLTEVPSGAQRSMFDDPGRVVLAVQTTPANSVLSFGFRAGRGQPFQLDLFKAWLDVVRGRLPPLLPLLLSRPSYLPDSTLSPHPLARFLPCPSSGHVVVTTQARADASFSYLDPKLSHAGSTNVTALLQQLGRTIDPNAPADPQGDRLVEPGVGRTVLVDGLALSGRPDLVDFTALGVGITPYAVGGFVDVGRSIDGMAGLDRSQHRRKCADRLEAAGCRAGLVVAIVALANSEIELAHAPALPAGIAIRGFRCLLRVKQLDPVAGFLHSHQHAPAAHDFMLHPAWSAITGQPSGSDRRGDPAAVLLEQQLLLGLETYALQSSLGDLVDAALAPPPSAGLAAALARRLAVIRLYAPSLLTLVRTRLAAELGTDPDCALPDNRDYAFWFAEQLGRQLGVFYKLRFLHDYLHEGIARWKPGHMYSLGENNVSLMAEFPDLDTGIFLDCPDPEQLDSLFITRADYDALDSGFAEFHQHDVTAARRVVKTQAFVALDGDPGGITEAQRRFTTAYQRGRDAAA